jgi:hypothetical protein
MRCQHFSLSQFASDMACDSVRNVFHHSVASGFGGIPIGALISKKWCLLGVVDTRSLMKGDGQSPSTSSPVLTAR